jgi:uncharacterized membrane protein YecN with MAPEG domain
LSQGIAIVAFWAGLHGLLLLGLAGVVVRRRVSLRVPLGDMRKPAMLQAMRVMANFAEYVPLSLLLMTILALMAAPDWLLHGLGGALLVGRLAHAQGLLSAPGRTLGRSLGIALTWTVLLIAALSNVALGGLALWGG